MRMPASNCAPSRASVFSGQYGPRHGVYTVGTSARGQAKDRKLIPIKNTVYLAPEIETLSEVLQAGGYRNSFRQVAFVYGSDEAGI